MRVSELQNPNCDSVVKFSRENLSNDSLKVSGCYALCNYEGTIMYIGQSLNLQNRMNQHLGDNEKTTTQSVGKIFWFYYSIVTNNQLLNQIEGSWVIQYKNKEGDIPILNKIMPPL